MRSRLISRACRPMLSAGARALTIFVDAFAGVVLFTSPVCALADSMSLSIAPDRWRTRSAGRHQANEGEREAQ